MFSRTKGAGPCGTRAFPNSLFCFCMAPVRFAIALVRSRMCCTCGCGRTCILARQRRMYGAYCPCFACATGTRVLGRPRPKPVQYAWRDMLTSMTTPPQYRTLANRRPRRRAAAKVQTAIDRGRRFEALLWRTTFASCITVSAPTGKTPVSSSVALVTEPVGSCDVRWVALWAAGVRHCRCAMRCRARVCDASFCTLCFAHTRPVSSPLHFRPRFQLSDETGIYTHTTRLSPAISHNLLAISHVH